MTYCDIKDVFYTTSQVIQTNFGIDPNELDKRTIRYSFIVRRVFNTDLCIYCKKRSRKILVCILYCKVLGIFELDGLGFDRYKNEKTSLNFFFEKKDRNKRKINANVYIQEV